MPSFEDADRRLLDRIFETSPTAIVVLTPEGTITKCNARAQELLALEDNEIEGRNYMEPEWTFTDQSRERLSDDEHPFVRVQDGKKWQIFGKGTQGFESDGTGIGLYLVEGLVAQFGGDVRVEDNEPRGTRFVVELQVAN